MQNMANAFGHIRSPDFENVAEFVSQILWSVKTIIADFKN